MAETSVPATAVAETLTPVLAAMIGENNPVRIEFWDGSSLGPPVGDPRSPGTLRVLSPEAVRRILWSPNELGLARAYVTGELDADGDIFALLEAVRNRAPRSLRLGFAAAPLV